MQTNTKIGRYYESVEFTLNDATTDYDLDANQSEFLAVFNSNTDDEGYPTQVKIRTDQTITVKINETTNDSITVTSTDSPMDIKGIKITNLYLTNASGSNAAVKFLFQQLDC